MSGEPADQRGERSARQIDDHRVAAVMRSVRCMQADVGEKHLLPDLARSASLSPFHFHRVFRMVTSATPGRFLAAARMAEAKRLLVRTSMSVTDICIQVGYSSLGTFTTQFTRLVGVSPRRFRQTIERHGAESFAAVLDQLREILPEPLEVQVAGSVVGGAGDGALVAAGLFRSGIPQELPAACAIVSSPGIAAFGGLPDGDFHALAMSLAPDASVEDALVTQDPELCYVGTAERLVQIRDGRMVSSTPLRIQLRPSAPVDPPLVLALPILLAAGVV
ncbi:helix-turn-helix transcriptional regulator [Saccharopolyspora cebuensis]|uniref:Helix-turn-helix transcriptional regulator n=1 Tax=Saccharopolyspora cebuensis TaxID=418759 RepID=A0ABV4CR42_9PSEU